jgi:signal transduction histidine kinase
LWVHRIEKLLAQRDWRDPAIDQYLADIGEAGRKVLRFSKSLAETLARSSETPAQWPVRQLIEEALASFQSSAHTVELEVTDDAGEVAASRRQIVSALYNLVTNAVEAMPGGGRVTVGAAGAGEKVKIWVQDTGRGIEPGIGSRIFDLGFTTKPSSSGFGLWSARRYVQGNGGSIELESEAGRGTTVAIYLPRAPGAAADWPASGKPEKPATP